MWLHIRSVGKWTQRLSKLNQEHNPGDNTVLQIENSGTVNEAFVDDKSKQTVVELDETCKHHLSIKEKELNTQRIENGRSESVKTHFEVSYCLDSTESNDS